MKNVNSTEEKKKSPGFAKAKDSRGREVEGLWIRNERFYCQIYVPSKKRAQLVPLYDANQNPIRGLREAQEAQVNLRKERSEGETPQTRRAPFFSEFYQHYITWMEETDAKDDKTIEKEKSSLKGWSEFFGAVRVSQITRTSINSYALKRKKKKVDGGSEVCNRTVNLDVIALSNCLNFAQEEGWIRGKLPTEGWKQLDYTAPERPLWTMEVLEAIFTELLRKQADGSPVYLSGEQIADWLRLLQWSGARRTAALSAKWDHISWERKQIKLYTKFDKIVTVDFNENLEKHLLALKAKRIGDCPWLFPTRRTKSEKGHLTRPYATLHKVREEVAKTYPDAIRFEPHDMRHFFTSWAVMAGIDYRTIAEWRGDEDNGMMISSVYAHLDPRHKQIAATKLTFTSAQQPAPVAEPKKEEGTLDLTKVKMEDLMKALQQMAGQSKAA